MDNSAPEKVKTFLLLVHRQRLVVHIGICLRGTRLRRQQFFLPAYEYVAPFITDAQGRAIPRSLRQSALKSTTEGSPRAGYSVLTNLKVTEPRTTTIA